MDILDGRLNSRIVLVSAIAAILGCVADVLLLYEPNAVYETGDYQFLLDIPQNRIYIGSILGVLTIPIYLSGIYVISMKYINNKLIGFISFMSCIIIAVIGCVYHGSIPLVAYILRKSDNPLLEIESIRLYFDIYAAGLAVTFFLFCGIFGYMMITQKQWILVMSNPIMTYLVCLLTYLAIPDIGRILLPAGFNLSVAILMFAVYHLSSGKIIKSQ